MKDSVQNSVGVHTAISKDPSDSRKAHVKPANSTVEMG